MAKMDRRDYRSYSCIKTIAYTRPSRICF